MSSISSVIQGLGMWSSSVEDHSPFYCPDTPQTRQEKKAILQDPRFHEMIEEIGSQKINRLKYVQYSKTASGASYKIHTNTDFDIVVAVTYTQENPRAGIKSFILEFSKQPVVPIDFGTPP